jgi:hypothetical protein
VALKSLVDRVVSDRVSCSRGCDLSDDAVASVMTRDSRLSAAPTYINRTALRIEGG